jgi:hypothetical protein
MALVRALYGRRPWPELELHERRHGGARRKGKRGGRGGCGLGGMGAAGRGARPGLLSAASQFMTACCTCWKKAEWGKEKRKVRKKKKNGRKEKKKRKKGEIFQLGNFWKKIKDNL